MTKHERQILKNQILIMDMLAYLIDQNDMFTCRYYDARVLADNQITDTDILIRKEPNGSN